MILLRDSSDGSPLYLTLSSKVVCTGNFAWVSDRSQAFALARKRDAEEFIHKFLLHHAAVELEVASDG